MSDKLRKTLGSIECPAVMHGDNLAIILCTAFCDGTDADDETGWSEAAVAGCNATLDAIHTHYAAEIERLTRERDEAMNLGPLFFKAEARATAAEAEAGRLRALLEAALWIAERNERGAVTEAARAALAERKP